LNRKGFRLTKKPSMEPKAAASWFFGWFAPEENQKFSKKLLHERWLRAGFSENQ
jgi:hypothetical protein